MTKQKRVEHVKWFQAPNGTTNSNKFLAVFEDGTIYVFMKEFDNKDDYRKQMVRVTPDKEYSREQIVTMMQGKVENFDFSKFYTKKVTTAKGKQKQVTNE
eukprot:CAMPEP_0176368368 /NCGR_PEP_ID=MMETSP0126-20121128/22539_1 /TAXON_ID=141414 ORGANISM="Strombidinopsis acuminatum, Strain SPMC142" /NCGR_SAMPLE_ID=MMETSP0126 /ASSEMBLY_ACC=CAM_ASM_000229 /LENGTH=99 /DNA_ID=CAMNT_0017726577 /DNA_START=695 /DNA_END=994 /DNA_ORIENTATION=+